MKLLCNILLHSGCQLLGAAMLLVKYCEIQYNTSDTIFNYKFEWPLKLPTIEKYHNKNLSREWVLSNHLICIIKCITTIKYIKTITSLLLVVVILYNYCVTWCIFWGSFFLSRYKSSKPSPDIDVVSLHLNIFCLNKIQIYIASKTENHKVTNTVFSTYETMPKYIVYY